ncbi:glycosyltransferase [Paeniglutamicibacter sp. NPDC091659]|uniref:glycosyltransferase family protein n=1 Tax=Paeniglutamicibacter sp. NPDC091659 TaxID=3364389 RepID=UPI003817E6AA
MNTVNSEVIVMIAGSRWEDTRGTDHRLAEALAKRSRVLWVDPPVPIVGPASEGKPSMFPGYAIDGLRPDLLCLRVLVPPGFTRAFIRSVATRLQARAIRLALAELNAESIAKIVLSPRERFPHSVSGKNILHVTDDWVAGAELMGLSRAAVQSTLARNLADADVVCAVSPYLADRVEQQSQKRVVVLPNGCAAHLPQTSEKEVVRRPVAGLIGQLNERIDMDYLEALADSGIPVEVIGPRRDRSAETSARLDRFLESENVLWRGEMPESLLWAEIEEFAVGLTPYADNEFNRASFPIKTLDYLSAGVPVIATDLPAVRWLNSEWIKVVQSPEEFVSSVRTAIGDGDQNTDAQQRRNFASHHTWDARARRLLDLIAGNDS